MAIDVAEMEVALTPFGIARHGRGLPACGNRAVIKRVDIVDIEDDTPPPGPILVLRLGDQVEIACAGTKAGEGSGLAAIQNIESQRAVEVDGARHFVGGKCDGADPFDHDANLPWSRPADHRAQLSRLATVNGLGTGTGLLRLQPQGQEPPARVGRADVRASIADVNGSLLLGQSFLEQVQILVPG
jgi:hypothetical protein